MTQQQLTFDEVVESAYGELISGAPDQAERLRLKLNGNLRLAGFGKERLKDAYAGLQKLDRTVVEVVVKGRVA